MRKIQSQAISEAVAVLCGKINRYLPDDVKDGLIKARTVETSPAAREVFDQLVDNCSIAAASGLPLCQDTGLAVVFLEVGRDVYVEGDLLAEAVQEGVRAGYARARLRMSVCDPFTRANTGDNTPAVIHTELVAGDRLRIRLMAKGGGSENMSRVTMLTPAEGWEGIRQAVLNRIREADANPCPPVIVGIGIGGTFDYAPILAKKALFRALDDVNPDKETALKEQELLEAINALGIGAMGYGGKTTALAVKIQTAPCHIASLPLAINIQCHSSRHGEVIL